MKVINAGAKPKSDWWLGKTYHCLTCKSEVQLEQRDELDGCVQHMVGVRLDLMVVCPICRQIGVLYYSL